MTPLLDITVYYSFQKEAFTEFNRELNYICDMYHNRLNGYKPPKTSRICLHLVDKLPVGQPFYFGSICSWNIDFKMEDYQHINSKPERYFFILNFVHRNILELTEILNWDREAFIASYESVIASDFKFIKTYPPKTSRNRKNIALLIMEKTELTTLLTLRIEGDNKMEITLVKKKNWFWYDSAYKIASKMSWKGNDRFGFRSKAGDKELYFSLNDNKVVTTINFEEAF